MNTRHNQTTQNILTIGASSGGAKAIGRLGVLAVALGIGTAVTSTPWVAVAEPSTSDASNSSSSASSDSSDESGPPSTSDEQSSSVESHDSSLSPSGPRVVVRSSGGADVSGGTDSETDDTEDVETTSTGEESLSEHDTSTASDEAEVTEPGENVVPENVVSEPDESVPADSEPVVESGGPPTEPKPTSNPAPESASDPVSNAGPAARLQPASISVASALSRSTASGELVNTAETTAPDSDVLRSAAPTAPNVVAAQDVAAVMADPPAPVSPVQVLSNLVSGLFAWLGLGPSATGAPAAPVESPGLWGLLAWVRREIQRTFFNRTATINYNPDRNGLTLEGDGSVSEVTGDLNAVDPDGDPVSFTVTQAPKYGTVVINRDGTFTYTPDPKFARLGLPDQFTVMAQDHGFHWHGPGGVFKPGLGHNDTAVIDIPVGPQLTPVVIATIGVGDFPLDVAFTPDGGHAYVTNADSDTVSVIDTATNTVSATITVGDRPYRVAVHPDGTLAYVTNYDDWTVSVIDTATNTVTDTISVGSGAGKGADHVVFSPDGTKAYVGSSNMLQVINTATNTVIDTRILGFGPYGIAVSPDGDWVYVASWTGDYVKKIRTLPNGTSFNIDVGNSPVGVTMSPDGTRLYVTNADSHSVSVIDTATDTVIETIIAGNTPVEVAISPVGELAYVASQFSGTIKVIDTSTNTVIKTFNLGVVTSSIAVSPDGKRAYVTDREGGTVKVMNLEPLLD